MSVDTGVLMRAAFAAALWAILLWALTDWSPPGERLAMPGKVIAGHARWESRCRECHKRFDRAAQSGLCRNCHRGIEEDIAAGRFHGFVAGRQCRQCHTEHAGRNAKIAELRTARFDHALTRFPLGTGRHRDAGCRACHQVSDRYKLARHACVDCHERDATADHRQLYGERCEACHADQRWRTMHFRHDLDTGFALAGRHRRVSCDACHRVLANAAQGAPSGQRPCADCATDEALAMRHLALGGAACTACHADARCQDIRGRRQAAQRAARCEVCHWQAARAQNAGRKQRGRCITCHLHDDAERGHRQRLGNECETCHDARGWNPWAREAAGNPGHPRLDGR